MTSDAIASLAGVAFVAVVLLLMTVGIDSVSTDLLAGFITLLVILILGVPMMRWIARTEEEPELATILILALVAKVTFSLVRYYVLAVVYSDNSDAAVYSQWGRVIADYLRQGRLPESGFSGRNAETERVAYVLGVLYAVTGVSRFAGTFFYTALCFGGQLLMWRAFRRAVPGGDDRRYALLVFFLPSLLFWPSSIGKDALMVACVGVASYGAAQLLSTRVSLAGVATFAVGAAGLMAIRPHLAMIAVVALAFGAFVGSAMGIRQRGASKSAMVRLIALVVVVGLAVVGTTQLGKLFAEEGSEGVNITEALERTQQQTGQGGSEFQPVAVASPLDLPASVVTVLFRPFPWEARNVNGLIAAGEGVLFAGLAIASRRRILTWLRMLPKNPYLIYCAAYALVFIVLFSYIGNFGILARQRTQMLPLVLVCLAMNPWPKTNRRSALRERLARRRSSEHAEGDTSPCSESTTGPHPEPNSAIEVVSERPTPQNDGSGFIAVANCPPGVPHSSPVGEAPSQ